MSTVKADAEVAPLSTPKKSSQYNLLIDALSLARTSLAEQSRLLGDTQDRVQQLVNAQQRLQELASVEVKKRRAVAARCQELEALNSEANGDPKLLARVAELRKQIGAIVRECVSHVTSGACIRAWHGIATRWPAAPSLPPTPLALHGLKRRCAQVSPAALRCVPPLPCAHTVVRRQFTLQNKTERLQVQLREEDATNEAYQRQYAREQLRLGEVQEAHARVAKEIAEAVAETSARWLYPLPRTRGWRHTYASAPAPVSEATACALANGACWVGACWVGPHDAASPPPPPHPLHPLHPLAPLTLWQCGGGGDGRGQGEGAAGTDSHYGGGGGGEGGGGAGRGGRHAGRAARAQHHGSTGAPLACNPTEPVPVAVAYVSPPHRLLLPGSTAPGWAGWRLRAVIARGGGCDRQPAETEKECTGGICVCHVRTNCL